MDKYLTGTTIKELREKMNITQSGLAELLNVSDKTVSKWETGKGYPDITLLEPIAKTFNISVAELLSGNTIDNNNISSNVLRSKIYVCPLCGNVLFSMGQAGIYCHGIQLPPLTAEEYDKNHQIEIKTVEDEYFVEVKHPMTKEHHISFMAAVSTDRIQLVKLYPEGDAQARFKINCVKYIYYYCNKDGLFKYKI